MVAHQSPALEWDEECIGQLGGFIMANLQALKAGSEEGANEGCTENLNCGFILVLDA